MRTYERKSFPRMSRDLKSMQDKGNLSFDNAVQRSFVWKNTTKDNRMSMLIDSMLRGLPIPPMYCNCIFTDVKSKIYDFLDGKQRTTTIIKFLKDEFSLVNIPLFEEEDGSITDLNGMTYSQLPEEYQDRLKTYSLNVYYYENMDPEDAIEMFRRLNNGKSPTAIELTRANAESIEDIINLGKHELFNIALSERSLAGYANEDIVIKTWILLYGDKKSFETKNVRPIMKETKITLEQVEMINKIFDMYVEVYNILLDEKERKIAKKILNKINMISLMSIFKMAIDENIKARKIKAWMCSFFSGGKGNESRNNEYNEIIKGRVAVTEAAVLSRRDILECSFKKFLDRMEEIEKRAEEEENA